MGRIFTNSEIKTRSKFHIEAAKLTDRLNDLILDGIRNGAHPDILISAPCLSPVPTIKVDFLREGDAIQS